MTFSNDAWPSTVIKDTQGGPHGVSIMQDSQLELYNNHWTVIGQLDHVIAGVWNQHVG